MTHLRLAFVLVLVLVGCGSAPPSSGALDPVGVCMVHVSGTKGTWVKAGGKDVWHPGTPAKDLCILDQTAANCIADIYLTACNPHGLVGCCYFAHGGGTGECDYAPTTREESLARCDGRWSETPNP